MFAKLLFGGTPLKASEFFVRAQSSPLMLLNNDVSTTTQLTPLPRSTILIENLADGVTSTNARYAAVGLQVDQYTLPLDGAS